VPPFGTGLAFRSGRKAKITASGTTVLIPDNGVFRASNGTELARTAAI
jgi:hypothetical protein